MNGEDVDEFEVFDVDGEVIGDDVDGFEVVVVATTRSFRKQ